MRIRSWQSLEHLSWTSRGSKTTGSEVKATAYCDEPDRGRHTGMLRFLSDLYTFTGTYESSEAPNFGVFRIETMRCEYTISVRYVDSSLHLVPFPLNFQTFGLHFIRFGIPFAICYDIFTL